MMRRKYGYEKKKDAHTKRIQKKEEIKKKMQELYCQKTKCPKIVHKKKLGLSFGHVGIRHLKFTENKWT